MARRLVARDPSRANAEQLQLASDQHRRGLRKYDIIFMTPVPFCLLSGYPLYNVFDLPSHSEIVSKPAENTSIIMSCGRRYGWTGVTSLAAIVDASQQRYFSIQSIAARPETV